MTYQEQIIRLTESGNRDFLRSVRATAEDKLEWKALDEGRTVLGMAQECAQSALWFAIMLEKRTGTPFPMDDYPKMQAERAAWSLDDCERIMQENTERLAAATRATPDEDLEQVLTLPWGDIKASLADIMAYHYWNVTYHLGQVNFIQTLYGDKEMH